MTCQPMTLKKTVGSVMNGRTLMGALILSTGMWLSACGSEPKTEAESEPTQTKTEAQAEAQSADSDGAAMDVATENATQDQNPDAAAQESSETEADAAVAEAAGETDADDTAPELAADAGEKLYGQICQQCHTTGLLDAPKIGDNAAWQPRVAKGMDTLYLHSVKGYNKMPAQAVGEVSEAQVKAAVDYLVAQSS